MSRQASLEKQRNAKRSKKYPQTIVEITQEKCKGCEVCVSVCPQGCLRLEQKVFNSKGFHPARYSSYGLKGECTACGLCYMVCPDYAVRSIKILKKKGEHS